MSECKECGTPMAAEELFCSSCGAKQADEPAILNVEQGISNDEVEKKDEEFSTPKSTHQTQQPSTNNDQPHDNGVLVRWNTARKFVENTTLSFNLRLTPDVEFQGLELLVRGDFASMGQVYKKVGLCPAGLEQRINLPFKPPPGGAGEIPFDVFLRFEKEGVVHTLCATQMHSVYKEEQAPLAVHIHNETHIETFGHASNPKIQVNGEAMPDLSKKEKKTHWEEINAKENWESLDLQETSEFPKEELPQKSVKVKVVGLLAACLLGIIFLHIFRQADNEPINPPPPPLKGNVFLSVEPAGAMLKLSDRSGKVVFTEVVPQGGVMLDLEEGKYYARLECSGHRQITRREIKASSSRSTVEIFMKAEKNIQLAPRVSQWMKDRQLSSRGAVDDRTGLPKYFRHIPSEIDLVLIPKGHFLMGTLQQVDEVVSLLGINDGMFLGTEQPSHTVVITKPFYLGQKEVSNRQFRMFLKGHHVESYKGIELGDDNFPAAQVSHEDAKAFCRRNRMRLPTEAEWEYACRAGAKGEIFWWGDDIKKTAMYCNGYDRSAVAQLLGQGSSFSVDDGFPAAAPVGSFMPNKFGLYDMLGNVREWCTDWYDPDVYRTRVDAGKQENPVCENSDFGPVLRGGSWLTGPDEVRCAARYWSSGDMPQIDQGFRVVLDVPDVLLDKK